jgi:DNA-binding NarL/FixJ family response regulator
MNMKIKVLLVEDHDIVRQGIKALLQPETDLLVVGEAKNGEDALVEIASKDPDVIVMDMNMPVMNGLLCTRAIKEKFPQKKVLILSMHDHENYLIDLLGAGAQGYILKNSPKEDLVFAIKKIANDGIYMGPEFTLNMLQKYKGSRVDPPVLQRDLNITQREMEVLKLMADGKTNAEIARELFTSVRTIETRRKNLLDKTQSVNTATLIRYAVKNGLVE